MFRKLTHSALIVCFFVSCLMPVPNASAQPLLGLPEPGTMVNLSPAYEPAIIKGVTVHKDNPFLFDFIVDIGQDRLEGEALKKEGEKLIKYFLANLAIPEKDLWVNLSPYEKDRTIPEALSQTEMGRDLLAQDYMLKQITASLIYPEKELGKNFWDRVYAKAQQMYGSSQVPVNTFNKVWIMADKASVFERNQTAFVVDCHLKVMLEEDYLALSRHPEAQSAEGSQKEQHSIASQIVKEIILPELEKEINTGKNFANLRQIFHSIILSSWYKNNLKQALLNQVYADKEKVNGIDIGVIPAKAGIQSIYERYLAAYKKGVFNYIKEDISAAQSNPPRKYFSGGARAGKAVNPDFASIAQASKVFDNAPDRLVQMDAAMTQNPPDAAMLDSLVNFVTDYQVLLNAHRFAAGLLGVGIVGLNYFSWKGEKAQDPQTKLNNYWWLHKVTSSAVLPAAAGLFTLSGGALAIQSGVSIDHFWFVVMLFLAALGKWEGIAVDRPQAAQSYAAAKAAFNNANSEIKARLERIENLKDNPVRRRLLKYGILDVSIFAGLLASGILKPEISFWISSDQVQAVEAWARNMVGSDIGKYFLQFSPYVAGMGAGLGLGWLARNKKTAVTSSRVEKGADSQMQEGADAPPAAVAEISLENDFKESATNSSSTIEWILERLRLKYQRFQDGQLAYIEPFLRGQASFQETATAFFDEIWSGSPQKGNTWLETRATLVGIWIGAKYGLTWADIDQSIRRYLYSGGDKRYATVLSPSRDASIEEIRAEAKQKFDLVSDSAMRSAEDIEIEMNNIRTQIDQIAAESTRKGTLTSADPRYAALMAEYTQLESELQRVSVVVGGSDAAMSTPETEKGPKFELSYEDRAYAIYALETEGRSFTTVEVYQNVDVRRARIEDVRQVLEKLFDAGVLDRIDNEGNVWKVKDDQRAELARIAGINPDAAMRGGQWAVANPEAPGGIDLNTQGITWKVSKDGKGVEMNVDPAMIERIKREGIESLTPVIFRITPIQSIWPIIGLEPPRRKEERLAKV